MICARESTGIARSPGNPKTHTPSLVQVLRFPVVCSTSVHSTLKQPCCSQVAEL
jgi:hypothetical protein